MSHSINDLLDAALEDIQISDAIDRIYDSLKLGGAVCMDIEQINDNGGFTAICERSNCRAGVFVSMDKKPLVTVAVNLSDALPLLRSANARRATLVVRDPSTDRLAARISCRRTKSGRNGTPLLMFETELGRFTQQREQLCVWLIATLFKRAA
jgi:hypothetical protein